VSIAPPLCYPPGMDHLWTPWRYAYVTGAAPSHGCIFCNAPQETDERARIVHRGTHCYIILNTYPYTNGHVMIVPYAHLDELQKLPADAAHEMMALTQRMEVVLRGLYRPDGINLGMNIGKAGGAGVAGHIHMHILPRWVADANFLSVIGETRVLPEAQEVSWHRIKAALDSPR
jgi:ATP adenylyltransferase